MPIAAHNAAEIFAGKDVKTPGLDKLLISRYRTNAFGYEIWDRLYDGSVQLESGSYGEQICGELHVFVMLIEDVRLSA